MARSPSETSSMGDSYWTLRKETDPESPYRVFELLAARARTHLGQRKLERSQHEFTTALHMCDAHAELAPRKYEVLGSLGWIERLNGRYDRALEFLQEAVRLADARDGPPARPRVQIAGELGTVYRQMDRLEEAREAFARQYEIAKALGLEGPMCRAIGNLGVVNYQLALKLLKENPDGQAEAEKLVSFAIEQLKERTQLALHIQEEEGQRSSHGSTTRYRQARIWEAIGRSRLSLCYTAMATLHPESRDQWLKDAAEAVSWAVAVTVYADHEAAFAMTRFFYGRVLLLQGHTERALEQFRPSQEWYGSWAGMATPVIAFCREPSAEHRRYLRELVDAGVDFAVTDQEGYPALDHAVFNGDVEAEAIVVDGLRRSGLSDADLEERQKEARLRRGYREIFQEKLRPILYRENETHAVKTLRTVYAEALAGDTQKSAMFDHLKVIRYTDFAEFGRLPRSSEGVTQPFRLDSPVEDTDFVIFFSYRWINQDKSRDSPDDVGHTQYKRMLGAVELFLQAHKEIKRENLSIWMDFACVDQDNPGAGVSALPIVVAQCDAVISLIDDAYYDRAWCCVEVMMIAQLVKSLGIHLWYEHVPDENGWKLRKAVEPQFEMKHKKLTYEQDRPKVLFLERQCRFLGRRY